MWVHFELLGFEPVSLVIKKGRLRWFGREEQKDDALSKEDLVGWCQQGYEKF